ncbi:MAG: nucleotidyltransferase domain-containing protein [Chitinophagaceae bacterium]
MDSLGNIIRKLREANKQPLRTVAAFLDIDQAILSKMERGQRKPTRAQVLKLADYFKLDENDLLVAWLSDKLVYELEDESLALQALQVAEEKVQYNSRPKASKGNIIDSIKAALQKDGRVVNAWLFGSLARGEENPNSDIDLMVELNDKKKYSLFDLSDISYILEKITRRKVDLVEKGYLKGFAMESASNELVKIYG